MSWLSQLADGQAHTFELAELPGRPDAPWRGLPVRVQLRLLSTTSDLDSLATDLPPALALLVDDLCLAGIEPPFAIECAGQATLGQAVSIGWLELGAATCRHTWGWAPKDYPFPKRIVFRMALQRFALAKSEPPVSIATCGLVPLRDLPTSATDDDASAKQTQPRLLQCTVGPDEPRAPHDNVLRRGVNAVDVFLGPAEVGALVGDAVSDDDLGFADDSWVPVQVQLTPLAPQIGVPSVGMLLVPKSGRSATLRLSWNVPKGARRARAQLALTREGRVVAVAELSGAIGKKAKLTGRLEIGKPDDDHRPSGGAVLVEGDAKGNPALIVPGAQRVELLPQLRVLAENVRAALNRITLLPEGASARAREAARKVLVAAAQAGRDLYLELEPLLGELRDATTVQVVTALAPQSLPLELAYLLPAPAEDAPICPGWLAGQACGEACWSEEAEVVCPAAFWGVSRVVERHYRASNQGEAVLHVPTPDAERRSLCLDELALAASAKVTDQVLKKAALDPKKRLTTWNAWRSAVSSGASMLVLLPHTLPKPPSLEVSGQTLHRSRITARYVTASQAAPPAVILFGCDTGGNADDPVGYTSRFIGAGAGVVFGSLSLLRAQAAAGLASKLVAALRAPKRAGEPVGEVLLRVRRDALREGAWAALALTAYGDANWEV